MDGFSVVQEICNKISTSALQIAEYEKSILQFQNHGEKVAGDQFCEVQSYALEQLQKLTLLLTGILVPQQEEEYEENLDAAEGGSVFMAGELDDKKPTFEIRYPAEEQEDDMDE